MKADEHGSAPKAEKYGMPIEYAPYIVARHFGGVDEAAALAGAQVAHDIKVSKALSALANRHSQIAAPEAVAPVESSADVIGEVQDWRAKLGLS